MVMQLTSKSPKVIIEARKGEAVVIGRAALKLVKSSGKGPQNLQRESEDDPLEFCNRTADGQASGEREIPTQPEDFDDTDNIESLGSDQYSSDLFEDAMEALEEIPD